MFKKMRKQNIFLTKQINKFIFQIFLKFTFKVLLKEKKIISRK